MNSKSGVLSTGEEDEFRGFGDDLLRKEGSEQDDVTTVVVEGPRVKKTLRQKALRVMLKRAGIKEIPTIEQIFDGKTGPKIRISEIGFIGNDKQSDPLLAELSLEFKERNRLNRDEILKSRILAVGSEIFKAGRMLTPIHVFHDVGGGGIECISGRHRLAVIAIVYGSGVKVPVYIENLTLTAAREAVAVANDSRPIKALERASYAILRAAGGDTMPTKDRIFEKMVSHKPDIGKYCVHAVIDKGHPAKLNFKLSERSSRPDGGITTVSNIEEFWCEALTRQKGMTRKEFEVGLLASVKFLNAFIEAIQKVSGFDADQHLTANMMSAIGRHYKDRSGINEAEAEQLASKVVEHGCDALC